MIRKRNKLNQDYNRIIFGFIFNGYRVETIYWEFFIIFRKVFMIIIVVFFSKFSANVQALCIFFVLNFFTIAHYKLRPNNSSELNNMEL